MNIKHKKSLLPTIILLSCVFVILFMIFFFSSQTGSESSNTSNRFTRFILSIFVQDFKDMDEIEQGEYISSFSGVVRKLAHFTEFALLAFFTTWLFSYKKIPLYYIFSFLFGFICAILDEVHQVFVDGRGPGVRDVIIDSIGVCFGGLFFILILSIRKMIKESHIKR